MLPDTLARDKQAAPLIRDSDLAPLAPSLA